jgi:peptidylprolyl isomerase
MILYNWRFSLLIFVFVSCKPMSKVSSSSYEGKEFVTESGLKYTIHKAGDGVRPELDDMVKVHYAGRLNDSTEFDNSYKRGTPIQFQLGKGQVIKGWDEGVALLNVGDSATFVIPPHLAYGSKNMGPIPANSTLTFDVKLMDVSKPVGPWDVSGLDTIDVRPGLRMIKIKENPEGEQPLNGEYVIVHYSGFFKNWKKFDSSVDRGVPFNFQLGQGQVIKGWDYGIAQLKKGEKARLLIDSDLAYGPNGRGSIPPNATLYFDVELIDIKH